MKDMKVHRLMELIFKKRLNQDEKLLKNIEKYEQKKKIEQQESKVYGRESVNRETDKEKSISLRS